MIKRIVLILLAVFVILGGAVFFIDKSIEKESSRNPFTDKVLSSAETEKILKEVKLDIDFKESKELYNDMAFPSDGNRFFTINSNKNIRDNFEKVYNSGKEEKIGDKKIRYREINRAEAIKQINDLSSNKKFAQFAEKYFDKDGMDYGIMEINNLGDNSDLYDEIYIICCTDSELSIFYNKM